MHWAIYSDLKYYTTYRLHVYNQLVLREVTLPEWLTGSPAISSCQRLGFARECSNRSGDAFWLVALAARSQCI